MAPHGDRYILSSGRTGHARLQMLCEIHDEDAHELLDRAGVTTAQRYVEFGCGSGTVSLWVASHGVDVTAIDLSQEQLAEARDQASNTGLKNIEFREANIYEHGLPDGSFDLSYSRYLLVHLKEPVQAMRKIYKTLKPGGAMVCEEVDVSIVYTEPFVEEYHTFRDLIMLAGEKRGVDYSGGRRLHVWAREAGFEVEEIGAYQRHYLSGAHRRFWSRTFREAGPLVAGGWLADGGGICPTCVRDSGRGRRSRDSGRTRKTPSTDCTKVLIRISVLRWRTTIPPINFLGGRTRFQE